MQLAVKTSEGNVLSLECEASATVDELKAKVGGKCRLFKGKLFLKGALTLAECGIADGDTLRAAKARVDYHGWIIVDYRGLS